jgi:predicted 3-demethylubiquinone-9 3-methyltransferase (glyoxalase superfamily)
MTVAFELNGQEFIALNGGPSFKFTEAISFVVNSGTQKEIDYHWDKLIEGGGEHIECGWLKDKYGLCWQIMLAALWDLMKDADAAKSQRVMHALMQMKKFDVAKLQRAAEVKE